MTAKVVVRFPEPRVGSIVVHWFLSLPSELQEVTTLRMCSHGGGQFPVTMGFVLRCPEESPFLTPDFWHEHADQLGGALQAVRQPL